MKNCIYYSFLLIHWFINFKGLSKQIKLESQLIFAAKKAKKYVHSHVIILKLILKFILRFFLNLWLHFNDFSL